MSHVLVPYIPFACSLVFQHEAAGAVPECQVYCGFTPAWFRRHMRLDYGPRWHSDPEYRRDEGAWANFRTSAVAQAAAGKEVEAMARKEKVTKVVDGDTFQTASRKNPVRLANVDAPEKGQSGATKATQALRNIIRGKQVTIDTVARDSYGRSVANVRVGGKSVNKAMRDEINR